MKPTDRLPLLALADRVCFPGARLEVVLAEPSQQRLVLELARREVERRWLGVVLRREEQTPPVSYFPAGTLARLVSWRLDDGERLVVQLEGALPFVIEEDLVGEGLADPAYPQARVRLLPEGGEHEPGLSRLCEELADLVVRAPGALGALATPEQLSEVLAAPRAEMINRLAQDLEVPPLRKLELLTFPLSERARHVAGILRARVRLLELLAPYRHLAAKAELN